MSCRPYSEGFLRRWPCWPGPYSRLLIGLLARPHRFTLRRRSILYFDSCRLDMSDPLIVSMSCPDSSKPTGMDGAVDDAATRFLGNEAAASTGPAVPRQRFRACAR